MTELPIHAALDDLIQALRARGRVVLQSPPGAGKTTVVPLAMMQAGLTGGRIVMLEPRRLAARAAAERIAETLGEPVGQTVGYRVRGESKVSKSTRIEVVTEGILTRRIQHDPELAGVGAVIFDEFHERSLNADLGLALCLEVAGALRDDLMLVAMSATLDAEPVAALMDAPMITSEGRSYPVETRWLDRPLGPKARIPEATADLVVQAVRETEGGVLVFLPGEGEIRRVEGLLNGRLPDGCVVRPLFGAMDFAAQRAAIQPATSGRKIVLATSIAETSLTIQDISVVVDAGRARRSRFDPASGMSRLVTERVTKAEATQRAGRAGRVAEGTCYRLWTRGQEGGLHPFPPAEIESADLSGLVLELAQWGADPADLPLLTQPNAGSYAEATALLKLLGALDDNGRITEHGQKITRLPLHPRLAHMLMVAGRDAAPLAALLADRDPLRGAPVDLSLRVEAIRDTRRFMEERNYRPHRPTLERIKQEAKRLAKDAPEARGLSLPEMAALAYPDRIGARRKGSAPRYLMSGGNGSVHDEADPSVNAPFLVITDVDGDRREARIRQAIEIRQSDLRALFADRIAWQDICEWSPREGRVIARKQERLGAIALDDRIWQNPDPALVARAMLDGVRQLPLPWTDAARRFAARVELARPQDPSLPSMKDADLLADAEEWLLPYLTGVKTSGAWKNFDMLPALRARLDYAQMQALDQKTPAHFTTPLGRQIPIDYSGEHPAIELRLQEMFGQTTHPTVAGQPLRVTLLSPARRPVQTTMDIPGFWDSSYEDVRNDMRGRYPKHPWPDDPRQADPTLRVKPRS